MKKKHIVMLKQHNKTGLKYLCYHFGTTDNAYTYKGSGTYWWRHLTVHGKDITSTILLETHNKEEAVQCGLKYSELWDVVNSEDFANLTVECCQTTAEPLQRPESRAKGVASRMKRYKEVGRSEREKLGNLNAIASMHTPEAREKAIASIRERFKNPTEKMLQARARISEHHKAGKFKNAYKQTSLRQLGKTKQELYNNPDYVSPLKGKTSKEIHGEDYIDPRLGITYKERFGDDYIGPKSKPFMVKSDDGETRYENEDDFLSRNGAASGLLDKLKKYREFTILQRKKRTRHRYKTGETLYLTYISS